MLARQPLQAQKLISQNSVSTTASASDQLNGATDFFQKINKSSIG